jgi:hypothetical protein
MTKVTGLVLAAIVLLPLSCGGGGSAATTGPAACHQIEDEACDKAYACVMPADRDTDFTDQYGTSLADCKGAMETSDCANAATQCPKANPAKVSSCISQVKAFTCDQFNDPTVSSPADCGNDQVCGTAP